MDGFTQAEELGRKCWAATFPKYEVDFSSDKYSWWDVSGYTATNTANLQESQPYIAEIKVREGIKHDRYDTVLLEVQKYDSLINYTLQSGIPSFYYCTYLDKTLVCNLSHLKLNDITKAEWWLPVHTKDESGFKMKDIYEVPLKYFTKINKGYKELSK
jgi:hypothetical protein